jgi:peptidoglycan/LPS O-acetylase OafA/YrhL
MLKRYGLRQEWLSLGYPAHLPDLHAYVWGYSIVNLASTALVLCLVTRGFFARIFENPILTYVGKISYGVYVWHLGILHLIVNSWVCDSHSWMALVRFIPILVLPIMLASASYFGYERFFLKMKDKPVLLGLLSRRQAKSADSPRARAEIKG